MRWHESVQSAITASSKNNRNTISQCLMLPSATFAHISAFLAFRVSLAKGESLVNHHQLFLREPQNASSLHQAAVNFTFN
jgi:hypothetical protein